jgi:hypothetical protein
MKKRVLAIFVVILMILHMVPVYAAVLEGSAERLDAPLIYESSTTILLISEGSYFKFIPTESTTYTINTTGSADSVAELFDQNGDFLDLSDDYIDLNFQIDISLI